MTALNLTLNNESKISKIFKVLKVFCCQNITESKIESTFILKNVKTCCLNLWLWTAKSRVGLYERISKHVASLDSLVKSFAKILGKDNLKHLRQKFDTFWYWGIMFA